MPPTTCWSSPVFRFLRVSRLSWSFPKLRLFMNFLPFLTSDLDVADRSLRRGGETAGVLAPNLRERGFAGKSVVTHVDHGFSVEPGVVLDGCTADPIEADQCFVQKKETSL